MGRFSAPRCRSVQQLLQHQRSLRICLRLTVALDAVVATARVVTGGAPLRKSPASVVDQQFGRVRARRSAVPPENWKGCAAPPARNKALRNERRAYPHGWRSLALRPASRLMLATRHTASPSASALHHPRALARISGAHVRFVGRWLRKLIELVLLAVLSAFVCFTALVLFEHLLGMAIFAAHIHHRRCGVRSVGVLVRVTHSGER